MVSRLSPFWSTAIGSRLSSFIQSGRRRSDATGWDIADLVIALLVAGAVLYAVSNRAVCLLISLRQLGGEHDQVLTDFLDLAAARPPRLPPDAPGCAPPDHRTSGPKRRAKGEPCPTSQSSRQSKTPRTPGKRALTCP